DPHPRRRAGFPGRPEAAAAADPAAAAGESVPGAAVARAAALPVVQPAGRGLRRGRLVVLARAPGHGPPVRDDGVAQVVAVIALAVLLLVAGLAICGWIAVWIDEDGGR